MRQAERYIPRTHRSAKGGRTDEDSRIDPQVPVPVGLGRSAGVRLAGGPGQLAARLGSEGSGGSGGPPPPETMSDRTRIEGQLRRALEALKRSDDQRRELLSRLVRAQEAERKAVAADIHDEAVQVMTAVSMRLAALRRRTEDRSMLESMEVLEESVSNAIQRLRRLLTELHPSALAHEGGLRTALREHLERLEADSSLVCTLEGQVAEPVSLEARAICFRVAQEALWNVRKHAKASRVDVLAESRDSGILVRIQDDGVGFAPDEVAPSPSGHLGLASMKDRTETAGGWLRLQSEPGRGTTVEYWIPTST